MKKLFLLLLSVLISTQAFASSALNFTSLKVAGQGQIGSDWISAGASVVTATGGGAVKGTIVTDSVKWRRVGDSMELRWDYEQSATGTTGTGRYILTLPGGYSIDTTKQGVSTTDKFAVGSGYFSNNADSLSGTTVPGTVFAYDSTSLGFAALSTTSTQSQIGFPLFGFANSANIKYTVFARVPISGWSSGGAVAPSEVFVSDASGWGSTNTYVPIFTNINKNTGSDITYATSASNGDSFTINTDGVYEISYSHYKYTTDANGQVGVSVNGNGATSIGALSYANGWRGSSYASFAGDGGVFYSTSLNLQAGDVVRPHTSIQFNASFDSDQITNFRITKVSN